MADYLKLFKNFRLSVDQPHHLSHIKVRLAAMKADADSSTDEREKEKAMKQYEEYRDFYKLDVKVEVKEVEEAVEEVDYSKMLKAELVAIAKEKGLDTDGLKKAEVLELLNQ